MYQAYNLKSTAPPPSLSLSPPYLNELSNSEDNCSSLLSSPLSCALSSQSVQFRSKRSEQMKHIETDPSVSRVLLAADNVARKKRQSDRLIEEEKAVRGRQTRPVGELSIKDVQGISGERERETGVYLPVMYIWY